MENITNFLQIILWIALPVLIIVSLVTAFIHYRHKKLHNLAAAEVLSTETLALNGLAGASPVTSSTDDETENNAKIIKGYVAEIKKDKEVIAHLKEEFVALEERYAKLKTTVNNGDAAHTSAGSHLQQQLSDAEAQLAQTNALLKQAENEKLFQEQRLTQLHNANSKEREQLTAEKNGLLQKVQQLELQLQTRVNEEAEPSGENNEAYLQLEKDNEALVHRVAELEYFQDMIQEKNLQISFLEKQVEQRVRQAHDVETNFKAQLKQTAVQLQEVHALRKSLQEALFSFEAEKQVANEQRQLAEKLRQELQAERNELQEKQTAVAALEHRLQQEGEAMEKTRQGAMADRQSVLELTRKADWQQKKIEELEGKLKVSAQLLSRIYSDLGKSFASIFTEETMLFLEPDEASNTIVLNGNKQVAAPLTASSL